jgi:hypothetical protein
MIMYADVHLDTLADNVKLSSVGFYFFLNLFLYFLFYIKASCSSTFCSNGGTCVLMANGVNKCACPAGYTGDQCTSLVNSMFPRKIAEIRIFIL